VRNVVVPVGLQRRHDVGCEYAGVRQSRFMYDKGCQFDGAAYSDLDELRQLQGAESTVDTRCAVLGIVSAVAALVMTFGVSRFIHH
jgi:hypothetical protein